MLSELKKNIDGKLGESYKITSHSHSEINYTDDLKYIRTIIYIYLFLVLCVLGNKCDLRHERKVSEEEAQEYAASIGALYYETSALSNEGKWLFHWDNLYMK